MAASLTEAMPIATTESTQLRVKKSTTSDKLFRPIQSETTSKTELACSARSCINQLPVRKKLTTLEAQRVMAVLTTAIRRVELASVLPQLVAERRADLDVGFGVELTRRLEEHGVLLRSLEELKETETKRQQSRPSSAVSVGSVVPDQREVDSALSQHSRRDATPTANTPDDQVTSPIVTRLSIGLHCYTMSWCCRKLGTRRRAVCVGVWEMVREIHTPCIRLKYRQLWPPNVAGTGNNLSPTNFDASVDEIVS